MEHGRAVQLRGAADHPTTAGELCPKVNRYLDRVYGHDRVTVPLRRTGPKGSATFEEIGWDEAIEHIATRLRSTIDSVGAAGILPYSFAGTQGAIQMGVMASRFFEAIGSSDIHRHLCGVSAWMGAARVSGQPFGIDPEDLRHSKTILLWGTNTLVTNRHLWSTIETARAGGATVVVIDPVRTSTAARADEFVQLRPGTDVALVLAMVQVLDREGLVDGQWLDEATSGWEDLRRSAYDVELSEAARVTGVAVERIEWLARLYAQQTPAAIRVLVGPEHREHGVDIMAALAMLPAVTGAGRQVGGGLARSTAVYFDEALGGVGLDTPGPGTPRAFPMADLGAVLTDRSLDPPVRDLIVHNCNPAVICMDQNRVLEGLARDDLFTVVIEQYLTDTARYADIVLPATTQLEHLDLVPAWGHLYLALNQPAIEPVGESLPNTEIFRRLSGAMGLTDPRLFDSDETLVRQLLDSAHPWLDGITFEGLVADGWARLAVVPGHRPGIDSDLTTPNGKLQLQPLSYTPGSETPAGDPDLASRYPLVLLTRKQHTKFLNAHYAGSDAHHPQAGEPLCSLAPADAAARGVSAGDLVELFNDRGTVSMRVAVDDSLLDGVVTAPFGWWNEHHQERRSINVLTNPVAPQGFGSAAFHETLVEVRLAGSGSVGP